MKPKRPEQQVRQLRSGSAEAREKFWQVLDEVDVQTRKCRTGDNVNKEDNKVFNKEDNKVFNKEDNNLFRKNDKVFRIRDHNKVFSEEDNHVFRKDDKVFRKEDKVFKKEDKVFRRDDFNRASQRRYVGLKLAALRNMNPKLYSECFVQPALEYFLATLCDYKVEPAQRSRLGLRYQDTPEVQRLLHKLQKAKFVSPGAHGACPNVIVSVLKEILSSFPGGIFGQNDVTEEFYRISLSSPLEITIVYLHGLLETLPYFLRQFTYLICRSLRNLVSQTSGPAVSAYTDLLLLFTPALFPSSVGDVQHFLRAARLTLVMVDRSDEVFRPVVWLDSNANVWHPLSEDEAFFHQILGSLTRLEASLDSDSDDECATETVANEEDDTNRTKLLHPSSTQYYQFTYVDP